MKTDTKTTLDRWSKNARFKKALEKEREALFLSEILTAMMEKDHITVRELAKQANLSPTIIQNIRSGKQTDLKISNLVKILATFGYHIELVKRRKRILLPMSAAA